MAAIAIRNHHIAAAVALIAAAITLTACQKQPPVVLPPPLVVTAPAPVPPAPPQPVAANLDEYKTMVAQQIVAATPEAVFHGQLPVILPAIVVLDVEIDHNGNIFALKIHRSRDDKASAIAVTAVKVAAPFPKPHHLLKTGHTALSFSETFLFTEDYQFQVRTLVKP